MHLSALPVVLAYLSFVPDTLIAASIAPNSCPPSSISVRIPPYLDPALNSTSNSSTTTNPASFIAPPLNFYTGAWYQTNTSTALYKTLSNLQWDLWPVLPTCMANSTGDCPPGTLAGSMLDITSWAIINSTNSSALAFGALGGGDRPISSVFVHDTPRRLNNPSLGPAWDGVWDYQTPASSGKLAFAETWSVMYWGLDAYGIPFMLIHETESSGGAPPVLDVLTRNPRGAEEGSLKKVLDEVRRLGNEEVNGLMRPLAGVNWDYELEGGPIICPESCQEK